MQDKRTNKRRLMSRFAGGWLAENQYLAETACARMSRKCGSSLPPLFWRGESWKGQFMAQLKHANRLLKKYSGQAIFAALKTKDGLRIFSLGAPTLEALIKVEQKRIDSLPVASPESEVVAATVEPPRPVFSPGGSVLSKLRGL